ncbi:PleD family two-component system response regulator [Pedobacter aquatilis]|uniref:response regulator n=1 Tax=Pedobacter aquatilis TaxID=351343 RepID=UPI002930C339|nr:response regulator [Pedobacter aquatilis]
MEKDFKVQGSLIQTSKPIKKILFIDDDTSLLEVAPVLFNSYQVYATSECNSVCDIIDKIKPDIVMIDIMMGFISGVEICAAIKQNPKYSLIPVILMTAGFLLDKHKHCNADGFLEKPFDFDETIALIERLAI